MIEASETFFGKYLECHKSEYDGNTIIVGCDDKGYIITSGYETINFSTED